MALGVSEVDQPRTVPDQSHLPITAVHTCMDCENERRLLAFCESEEKTPSTEKMSVFFTVYMMFPMCVPATCNEGPLQVLCVLGETQGGGLLRNAPAQTCERKHATTLPAAVAAARP